MELLAPAKINLSLDILSRRADGYHELRMVMQSISLCDSVMLEPSVSGRTELLCDDPSVPCGGDNTVLRAAEAFFRVTGISAGNGLLFRLRKKIPPQSGLGGGSADAAAALKLLNRFSGLRLSGGELEKIGLSVGADVPFCISGGTSLAEGVGEKLRELPAMPHCCIVVCRPNRGCATKEAYEAFDAGVTAGTDFSGGVLTALSSGSLSALGRNLGNAFQRTVSLPAISEIRQELLRFGAAGSCMTGSGSAVFGLFAGEKAAAACRAALARKYPFAFLCRPLARDEIPGIRG